MTTHEKALRRAQEFIDDMSSVYNFTCADILAEIDTALSALTPPDVAGLVERLNGIPVNWVDLRLGKEAASTLTHLAAENALLREREGWRLVSDEDMPPHDVPVLLWSPPSLGYPHGVIEARPYSTGRWGDGWSEYSQHSHATHWRSLPASPSHQEQNNG